VVALRFVPFSSSGQRGYGNRLFHFYNGGQRSRFGHFAIAAFSKFFPPRKEGIYMLLLVWMAD
jgi:hypothetical protein